MKRSFKRKRVPVFAAAFVCIAASVALPAVRAADPPLPLQTRDTPLPPPALTLVPPAPDSHAPLRRVALVVGNEDYAGSPLKNAVSDAQSVADTLKGLGFDVILETNLTHRQMDDAVDAFARKLDAGCIGLFYFSGHGMQVGGTDYLVPVGAPLMAQSDAPISAFPAQRLLNAMGQSGCALRVVILDGSLPRRFQTVGNRGLGVLDAPPQTLIAYAMTSPQAASDGLDTNHGLYASALLTALKTPGLKIEDVFKQTRIAVIAASQGQQTPWEASSLETDFYPTSGPIPALALRDTSIPGVPAPQKGFQPNPPGFFSVGRGSQPNSINLRTTKDAAVISSVDPEVPESLLGASFDYRITVVFSVHANGRHVEVITQGSGNADIDRAVLSAMSRYKFRPALKDGKPVESTLTYIVNISNKSR